jgi:hypothetical protein
MRRTSIHVLQRLTYCGDGSGRYHESFAKAMALLVK